MKKFWNWVRNTQDGTNDLYLDGAISDETWFGDEITPALFKDELSKRSGDVTVWINSPGGDVFAAAQIYTMLRAHDGNITVKIHGIAASAASVVAMAGDNVLISPVGMLMIHNPSTMAAGEKKDMEKAIELLDEVKETILNAYESKTGLSRNRISKMMDEESWFNAKKAKQLGFVDGILFDESEKEPDEDEPDEDEPDEGEPDEEETKTDPEPNEDAPETEPDEEDEPDRKTSASMLYSNQRMIQSFLTKLSNSKKPGSVPVSQLRQRLELLKF